MSTQTTEIAIIGGSNAGLSAALTLGRSRRKVTVIDDGKPRNAGVRFSYGLYTRDKTPPSELVRIGREQLEPYNVKFIDGHVSDAIKSADGFLLILADGTIIQAQKIILATGVKDALPAIPGLAETWGISSFSCPYCDGWEIKDKPIAVIGDNHKGYGFTFAMHHWSPNVVLCLNGAEALDDDQMAKLERFGIRLYPDLITKVEHTDGKMTALHFANGAVLERSAVFTQPPCSLRDTLAQRLGCTFEKDDTQIVVDCDGRTAVEGVYAAGDAATNHSHLVTAAASGALAAMAINHDLFQETYR